MTNDTDRAAITKPSPVYAPVVIADSRTPHPPNKPAGFGFININPETDPPPQPLPRESPLLDGVRVSPNDVFRNTNPANRKMKKLRLL
ncbi:hypothetical protein CEXT_466331 [Caerostris extrusa]|uniref:Uncharacterized protein n=1 Tax=Caerostris extrusa TaxID=172846 RepID=A0AAV4U8G8_CAEEX|nr:hypothetical protein CEXT_466331 [Caerostris extrusa]